MHMMKPRVSHILQITQLRFRLNTARRRAKDQTRYSTTAEETPPVTQPRIRLDAALIWHNTDQTAVDTVPDTQPRISVYTVQHRT